MSKLLFGPENIEDEIDQLFNDRILELEKSILRQEKLLKEKWFKEIEENLEHNQHKLEQLLADKHKGRLHLVKKEAERCLNLQTSDFYHDAYQVRRASTFLVYLLNKEEV